MIFSLWPLNGLFFSRFEIPTYSCWSFTMKRKSLQGRIQGGGVAWVGQIMPLNLWIYYHQISDCIGRPVLLLVRYYLDLNFHLEIISIASKRLILAYTLGKGENSYSKFYETNFVFRFQTVFSYVLGFFGGNKNFDKFE